jgi:hypothetical protein
MRLPFSLMPWILAGSLLSLGVSANAQLSAPQGAVGSSTKLAAIPYSAQVSQLRLTQKAKNMTAAFPATGSGPALARIATLYPYGVRQDYPQETRQMAQDLASLRAAPDQALTDLRTGFQRLPQKYWAERQFLIQMGGRLPAPQAQVVDFLVAEMSRTIASTGDEQTALDHFSPAIAADTLLAVVKDPERRDAVFAQAVKAQPDENIGRLILSRYEKIDPVRAKDLANRAGLMSK